MLHSDAQNPDNTLWVKFYKQAVQNNFRSEKEGRPYFDEIDFVSIITPADPTNKVDRKASPDDKERFPKQWANYQNGQSEKIDGTLIEEWPQITRSRAEELRHIGVRTLEQLASLSDGQTQKIMGGVSLRERAKAFLVLAKDTAAAQRIAAQNAELRSEIDALKAQIAALGKTADTPKRRGRPPKAQPEAQAA